MADRVLANQKIEPIWNTVVTKYIPDEKGEMRAVMLRNVKTNEERELPGCLRLCGDRSRSEHESVSRETRDRSGRLSDREASCRKQTSRRVHRRRRGGPRLQTSGHRGGLRLRRGDGSGKISRSAGELKNCANCRAGASPAICGRQAGRLPYNDRAVKICDLTQFYSPLSGGVKRYVHEKIDYIQAYSRRGRTRADRSGRENWKSCRE